MNLSDDEVVVYATCEAQLVSADHVQPGACSAEKTIQDLLEVLDRDDVVEAVDRLEDASGLRIVD